MPDPAPTASLRARLLVAEDEPHIQRILAMLLEAKGFEVAMASDGSATLEHLRGSEPFDLLLLDLMMPGASGLEILQWIRSDEERRDLPVIVLTAKGQDQDRDRAFSLGAQDFMTKPFSPKKLLARIQELLPHLFPGG